MIRKYLLPLLAIGGILFAIFSVISGSKPVPAAQPVALPSQSPFASQIAGSGLVEANTENIAIGTIVSGVATNVAVKVNQDVSKGDVLFQLDDRDLQAEKRLREAALLSAKRKLDKLVASPRPEDVPPAQAKVAEMEAMLADAKSQFKRAEDLKDTRAISEEDLTHRRYMVASVEAQLANAKAMLSELKAGTWAPDIEIARADVASAEASLKSIETSIERLVVRAPITGRILQLNVRPGEFAQAGVLQTPLILMGNVDPLFVRVDVDENDAWRVDVEKRAGAEGVVRGNRELRGRLKFVRVEPYVVPKKSLTGDTTERVDTRVLQIIYSLEGSGLKVYPGQQMDIFIDAPPPGSQAMEAAARVEQGKSAAH